MNTRLQRLTCALAIGCSLLLAFALRSPAAGAGPSAGKPASIGWQISGARVLKPGQLSTNQAGIQLNGYAVEAGARGTNGGRLSEATFHLALNAFCPRTNHAMLKAGRWHVWGTWVVVEKPSSQLQSPTSAARPHLEYLQGYLLADLDACPTDSQPQFSAEAWASETRPFGPQNKYEGSFQGRGRFEGRLSLKPAGAGSEAGDLKKNSAAPAVGAWPSRSIEAAPKADRP